MLGLSIIYYVYTSVQTFGRKGFSMMKKTLSVLQAFQKFQKIIANRRKEFYSRILNEFVGCCFSSQGRRDDDGL